MYEQRIPVEGAARLTLTLMDGNVAISGWEDGEVLVRMERGSEEDLRVEDTAEGPALSVMEDCELHVPAGLPVHAVEVRGNLAAKGLAALQVEKARANVQLKEVEGVALVDVFGNLSAKQVASLQAAETVHGNVSLDQVGAVELPQVRGNLNGKALGDLRTARVYGNLHVKQTGGPIISERVGGNVFLKDVGGAVSIDKVGGNFAARNLTAGAKVPKIGGNLALNGEIGAGCTYHFKAGGNGLLRLSEGASAHLTLSAGGAVHAAAELSEVERSQRSLRGTLGDGGAEIVIEASGNVMVSGKGQIIGEETRQEISRQVEESLRLMEESLRAIDLETIGQQVSAEMDHAMAKLKIKLVDVDWENLGRRTQRSIERAMEHVQRDIDRAVERATRRQEKLERMTERATRHHDRFERHVGSAGRTSRAAPDLDAERLAILKMLEEGKVSAAEAETLLEALG